MLYCVQLLSIAFLRGGFKTAVEIAGNIRAGEIVICLGEGGLLTGEAGAEVD